MRSLLKSVGFAGWVCFLFPLIGKAAARETPFVAGFERFARHGEIGKLQAGRLLLTELSCTACHTVKNSDGKPKGGPQLNGAGNRLSSAWIKKFLASPQDVKPGTTMPDMLRGWPRVEKHRAIQSLTAFLKSQQEPYPEIKGSGLNPVPFEFWNKGDPEVGKRLYHRVGCVACHSPDSAYETVAVKPSALDQMLEQLDAKELAELGLSAQARRVDSIPLGDLAAKYSRKSLAYFLLDPAKIRPAGRMPSLKFTAMEASDLTAYLLRGQTSPPEESAADKAEWISEGRILFADLRCNHCHEVKGVPAKHPAKPLPDLNGNAEEKCFGKPTQELPFFALDQTQVEALEAVLAEKNPTPKTPAADEFQLRLLQLNCYACHERDNQGGVGRYRKAFFETVGHVDIGDEGRLPPPLSGVGRKLTSAWLNQVLKGTGDLRSHMRIRMPVFPANAVKDLPALFAKIDHPAGKPQTETAVFGKLDGLAQAGRKLMDQGCVECHAFRGESLPGVVGVDLEGITRRVQPTWFHDFLLNPAQLKPRTRMPTFFPQGISQNKTVLKGNADRQIAAMWAYLKALDKQPLPEKIAKFRAENYELKPVDRPMVLRTFMKAAGTHAIAVGFPQQVHFAFDAENSRVAVFWRGRFLDAQGTWFSRFTPPADPLGEDVISLPSGLPFAVLKEAQESWPKLDPLNPAYRYQGYRLDEAGVPTFLYRFGRFDIEDRIVPFGKRQFHRQFTIKNRKPKEKENSPTLWFRPLVGKTMEAQDEFSFKNEAGLRVTVSKALGQAGKLRRTEWLIPLNIPQKQTIEVNYAW